MKWVAIGLGAAEILGLAVLFWDQTPKTPAPRVDKQAPVQERAEFVTVDVTDSPAVMHVHYLYALAFYQNSDFVQAKAMLELLSDKGYIDAKVLLANMYRRGAGTKQDIPKAVELLQEAAEAENASAMYALGSLYLEGHEALAGQEDKARHYIQMAADAGYEQAAVRLEALDNP